MEIGDIKRVAVFGAGTMGPGLAQVFATAGYSVALTDLSRAALEQARSVLEANLDTFMENGLVEETAVDGILDRVTLSESADEAAADADLVVECIVEKREAKKALYERLDALCPPRTIIASNTSYLNIFELMPESRQANTVIAHWFAPPHIVPLVEVVRGERTDARTVDLVVELLKKVDHAPVVMEKFLDGFCVNRLLRIIGREVFFQIDNGYITPEMLDVAVKASIIPRALVLGFVQRYDFTGLDLSAGNLQNKSYLEPPLDNEPECLVDRVRRGECGVKSGKGFYDYGGRPLEEVLHSRDVRLLRVFHDNKDLIYDRI